jgi:Dyp-type peroxidase family
MAPTLDRFDIQGGILNGYGFDFGHAAYLFLEAGSAGAARRCLEEVAARGVTTAEEWQDPGPDTTLNVAITFAGLTRLGLAPELLDRFPAAFRALIRDRAEDLGDVGESHPDNWEDGLGTGAAHLLLIVHARSEGGRDAVLAELRQMAGAEGLRVVHALPVASLERRGAVREHFGFADGFAQPDIEGVPRLTKHPAYRAADDRGNGVPLRWGKWRPLKVGEFLLGHPDEDGQVDREPVPELVHNGTYMVYRKLYQDVAGFRLALQRAEQETGWSQELVAAKIVGRWRDGIPVEVRPDRQEVGDLSTEIAAEIPNAFRYLDDGDGYRCPLGAHVRRANPRDALGFGGALSRRHRIIRRGMPYGPRLAPDAMENDGEDRGLAFVCYNADIERQFETVQAQWCNDGDPFHLGDDRDYLASGDAGSGKMTIPVQGAAPRFIPTDPDLVQVRGSEYLFVPGIRGLRLLVSGRLDRSAG